MEYSHSASERSSRTSHYFISLESGKAGHEWEGWEV